MTIESTNKLTELKALAKVVYWLADGASPYQHDLSDRIDQISELATELAENACNLSNEIERNSDE